MTLRRRWALSILAILLLFGLNLAVYFWGNTRRTEFILELKNALESKDLVVEIRTAIAGRQRDAEVMEPLLMSESVALSAGQLADIRQRTETIKSMIQRLQGLWVSDRAARLGHVFEDLQTAWFALYEPAVASGDLSGPETPPPAQEVSSSSHRRHYAQVDALLEELQASATAGAERSEREFAAVAALTDRVTLAIFVVSSLLAIAIAFWFSRFLRATFARYVTTEVVESVLATPAGLALGGEKRHVTVLMADLRGFTSMSERIAPEKVVAVINNFLGVMTDVIVENGGTIDEFIGDAILVIFGAPRDRADHAQAAVRCAIEMQLGMREVNARNRCAGLPTVEMGIGIHTGEIVVGNIGSEKRTKYGAVGASVNLAARIEANTVGGQILISKATFNEIASELRVDGRIEIHPKGLEQPVLLFDIGGIRGSEGEADLSLPIPGEQLVPVADDVSLRFVVMEGSRAGTREWEGRLLSLSPRAARVQTSADVAPLANLRLELLQGSDAVASRSVFAKILTVEPHEGTFIARFTWMDSETAALLEHLRG